MPSCTIEEHARADYVRVNEVLRGVDAAIDVRFRGKIYDCEKLVLGHDRVHLIGIGDVRFEKLVALAMFLDHTVQIGWISGIGEHIHIGHIGRLVMFQNVANKVAPDESAATGYENAHSAK